LHTSGDGVKNKPVGPAIDESANATEASAISAATIKKIIRIKTGSISLLLDLFIEIHPLNYIKMKKIALSFNITYRMNFSFY